MKPEGQCEDLGLFFTTLTAPRNSVQKNGYGGEAQLPTGTTLTYCQQGQTVSLQVYQMDQIASTTGPVQHTS